MMSSGCMKHGGRLFQLCCRNTSIRYHNQRRELHLDTMNRLSHFWTPSKGIATSHDEHENVHSLLERAGIVRASHSGVFHFLPLGVRILEKLERLIDKHMRSIGASKVSLSAITTEKLWQKSGRLDGHSEILRIKDRKNSKFFLSPTHEEEITTLVANTVHSYKDTPLRLYQIGRKYRDELRPRAGLLRAREFLMKDLYTFDASRETALETYEEVTKAYHNFFRDIGVPYLRAKASSGAMGGDMSHEYHYPAANGEDTQVRCPSCSFVANTEVLSETTNALDTKDHNCSQCESGRFEPIQAIEVGHTFYLGTRYSVPLSAQVQSPTSNSQKSMVHLEMGCHGIGLSRLIPAIVSSTMIPGANMLAWPRVIAPFEIIVVPGPNKNSEAVELYEHLQSSNGIDIVLDDRDGKEFGWKMKDADLVGYPVIIVVGKTWETQSVEVQWYSCGNRQKEVVSLKYLKDRLEKLLEV